MLLMTLPKTVEYAIKILVCLTLSMGRPVSASEVARCVRIPPSQAAKVLHYLSWRGLTRSRRGSLGGYLLKEDPEQINLERVIQLFQASPDEDVNSSTDPLLQIWSQTFAHYQEDWQQLTIAELARRTAGHWVCSQCTTQIAASPHDNEEPSGT